MAFGLAAKLRDGFRDTKAEVEGARAPNPKGPDVADGDVAGGATVIEVAPKQKEGEGPGPSIENEGGGAPKAPVGR